MNQDPNWRLKTLLTGGLIGALTGLTAAYMLIQRSEETQEPPRIGAGQGVRLGLLVLGLLRQVGELGSNPD